MIHLESRLSDGSVPLGVRSALRQAIGLVAGEGIQVIDKPLADYVSLAARGKPIAVYVWPSRLSIALDPQQAEHASDSESALTLEKDSNVTWFVHGSFSALTGARKLDLVTSLLAEAFRRSAQNVRDGGVSKRGPQRHAPVESGVPRCPSPGCNLPLTGGSCGFH
jgi:hypothetical protein